MVLWVVAGPQVFFGLGRGVWDHPFPRVEEVGGRFWPYEEDGCRAESCLHLEE